MDPAPQPSPDRFGPYELHERLGIGGMATVHRAKKRGPEGFERSVALKRMLQNLAEDSTFVESFVREAKVASLLVHPNIAQVYDFGRIGGVYYIAMELVQGLDIRKLLRYASRSNEPIPLGVVLSILGEMCDALDHAHNFVDEHGAWLHIVHRDVSPSNLIVAHTGHVKIIDFGIAKASSLQLHTESGQVKGKLGYMSPEVVHGMPIGPVSDVFSAGVVAWELVTASPLFTTRTDFETMRRIREADIVAPSRHNPTCPPELDQLILAALERDPDRRLASAAMFRTGLDAIAARAGVQASARVVAEWMARFAQPDDHWQRPSASGAVGNSVTATGLGARRKSPSGAPSGAWAPSGIAADDATSNIRANRGSNQPPQLRRSLEDIKLAAEIWGEDAPTVGSEPGNDFSVSSFGERSEAGRRQRVSTPMPTQLPPPELLPPAAQQMFVEPPPQPRGIRAPIVVLVLLAGIAAGLGAYLIWKSPSDSTPAVATVRIVVQPAGSVIEIGGKEVGRSSPLVTELAPGTHEMTVQQDGYKPHTSTIVVTEGEHRALDVVLDRAVAHLSVDSRPRGLPIELDGKPTPHTTPATFDTTPGAHSISVRGPTGEVWTEQLTAVVDATYSYTATLAAQKPTQTPAVTTRTPPDRRKKPPRVATVDKPPPEPDPVPPVVVVEPVKPPVTKPPVEPVKPPVPPPDTKPARTPVVAATAVTKVSGEVPILRGKSGDGNVLVKMCIDEGGRVTSVRIVKSTAEIASELQRALAGWRYKPYVRDGKPTPVCFPLSVRLINRSG